MAVVYLGLGSNLGDRAENLRWAVQHLHAVPGLKGQALSQFRRSEAVGGPPQPDYVNAVWRGESSLSPLQLLQTMLGLEARRGRRRQQRWGPRTLDLDLLLYGCHQQYSPALQVPHPRIMERRFVLEPLAELNPRLALGNGRTVVQQLASLGA